MSLRVFYADTLNFDGYANYMYVSPELLKLSFNRNLITNAVSSVNCESSGPLGPFTFDSTDGQDFDWIDAGGDIFQLYLTVADGGFDPIPPHPGIYEWNDEFLFRVTNVCTT